MLTPSLKVKRRFVWQRYQPQIEALYTDAAIAIYPGSSATIPNTVQGNRIGLDRSGTGVAVLSVQGEHDVYTAPSLTEQVEGLIDERVPFVIDLTPATFVDSSVLRVLLEARRRAEALGLQVLYLGDRIEGESRDIALMHAGIARQCAMRGQPEAPPCVLISGGETTITLKGKGKGGRNTEFLLALAIALDGMKGIYALAGDTDGIDGSEDNAGAIITPDTLLRAERAGLNAKAMLADNDPWTFFNGIGDLLVTGPTLTNVNDFRAVLIERK